MIGAIIGDLAAWTWENDHEKFYPFLISEKALLSEFGLSVLATADALDFNLFMNEENIRNTFVHGFVLSMTISYATLKELRSGLKSKTITTTIIQWP